MLFQVRTEQSAGQLRVIAIGELDMATRHRLKAAVIAALQGELPVLVDLTRVTFVDSSGLQTLVELDATARERACALRIRPGAQVRRVLQLTALERRLSVVEDDDVDDGAEAEVDA